MGRKPGGQAPCSRVAPTSSYVKDMGTKGRAAPGNRWFRVPPVMSVAGQLTLIAVQEAPTVLYSVLSAPYRSDAALRVAVRASA
ncbi:hypothetical protein JCM4020_55610 [Streptomyces coelicolor]|nr:hypothetical protein JCM4020_55610 [Streptomyces coelicolor]